MRGAGRPWLRVGLLNGSLVDYFTAYAWLCAQFAQIFRIQASLLVSYRSLALFAQAAKSALTEHSARLRINFSRIDATSSAEQILAVVRLATAVKLWAHCESTTFIRHRRDGCKVSRLPRGLAKLGLAADAPDVARRRAVWKL